MSDATNTAAAPAPSQEYYVAETNKNTGEIKLRGLGWVLYILMLMMIVFVVVASIFALLTYSKVADLHCQLLPVVPVASPVVNSPLAGLNQGNNNIVI